MQSQVSFYNDRRIIFYVGLGFSGFAALLSFVVAVVYGASYSHSVYLNGWGVALPIVGLVIFGAALIVQMFLGKTNYVGIAGAVALWLLDFIGFIVFINASYLYLSEVFFAGVTADAFANMEGSYIVCVLFFLLATVFSNIGMFMIACKPKKEKAIAQSAEEVAV